MQVIIIIIAIMVIATKCILFLYMIKNVFFPINAVFYWQHSVYKIFSIALLRSSSIRDKYKESINITSPLKLPFRHRNQNKYRYYVKCKKFTCTVNFTNWTGTQKS